MSHLARRISAWVGRRQRKPRSRLYRVTNRTVTVLGIAYLCNMFIAEEGWRRTLLNPRAPKAFGAYFIGTGKHTFKGLDPFSDRLYG